MNDIASLDLKAIVSEAIDEVCKTMLSMEVEIKSEAVNKASVVFLNMVFYSFVAIHLYMMRLALQLGQIKTTSFS